MEIELKNLKGTRDYLPGEQQLRNKIRDGLEKVFRRYGYRPVETPMLCLFDILASKYGGGSEILKEIYRLKDQGGRELALRYDLTIPFARIIGMNPNLRLPFKRYEIGRVFRDGPVKTGRLREFMQCDVDIAGVESTLAESEIIALSVDAFEELGLEVYISYNNRKLLTGALESMGVPTAQIGETVLSLDKVEKIGKDGVREELAASGLARELIENIFLAFNKGKKPEDYLSFSDHPILREGIAELQELEDYLRELNLMEKAVFNPLLARGLEIYTGTVFEIFLSNSAITSSIGGGGRYDKIIGSFLDDGSSYPAVGISFGLDVIYTALTLDKNENRPIEPPVDFLLIPLGTEKEILHIAQNLRKKGFNTEVVMSRKRLKRSLDYANKEQIPYVLILGEDELKQGEISFRDMYNGKEEKIPITKLNDLLKTIRN